MLLPCYCTRSLGTLSLERLTTAIACILKEMSFLLQTLAFVVLTVRVTKLDATTANDTDMSVDQVIIDALKSMNHSGKMQDASIIRVELDMIFLPDVWEAMRYRNESDRRKRRKAILNNKYRWPNAVVPYVLSSTINDAEMPVLREAMTEYEKYTCIRFRKANNDSDYVAIVDNLGCSSDVGRQGGPQELSLSFKCRNKRTILHELGHAIGFVHEHSRLDRDDYVTINETNILQEYRSEFSTGIIKVDTAGIPYDYMSIMHYSEITASNGMTVIKTKDSSYQKLIGRRKSLSFRDVKLANWMYSCSERNGCQRKFCPGDGYVGQDCLCWCPSMNNAISAELCEGGGDVVKVELDMLFTAKQWDLRQIRSKEIGPNGNFSNGTDLWPNATVPYVLRANFSNNDQIALLKAMEQLHMYSCLRFRERTGSDDDYVEIVDTDGCSSFVGRKGGPQPMSLAPWCLTGTPEVILHEMGHVIGIEHEHNRPDRDNYIFVNKSNVHVNSMHAFDVVKNVHAYDGIAYDYLSVMHFSEKAFSNNGRPAILAKDAKYQSVMGKRRGLSFGDVKLFNTMYQCAEKSNCPTTSCPPEAFVGQDCDCWCPSHDSDKPAGKCTERLLNQGDIGQLKSEFAMEQRLTKSKNKHDPAGDELLRNKILWKNATVPFNYANNLSPSIVHTLLLAINHFQKYSCIRFPECNDSDDDCITFVQSTRCQDSISRAGGRHNLTLGVMCTGSELRVFLHILSRVVGVGLEHNRPDRDQYVTINTANVGERFLGNFLKDQNFQTYTGIPYDYHSIMHYSDIAYSRNGGRTILAKDPSYQRIMGKKLDFSFFDVKRLNMMYRCAERSGCSQFIRCPGEGFVGQDCRCWCRAPNWRAPAAPCTAHCTDFEEFCGRWKERGFCTNEVFIEYMSYTCPRSCGFC